MNNLSKQSSVAMSDFDVSSEANYSFGGIPLTKRNAAIYLGISTVRVSKLASEHGFRTIDSGKSHAILYCILDLNEYLIGKATSEASSRLLVSVSVLALKRLVKKSNRLRERVRCIIRTRIINHPQYKTSGYADEVNEMRRS